MFKKTMLMASMAVAAIAFAVPAVASADWTEETQKVETEKSVTFSGNASFTSSIGGITCESVHSNTTLTPGTTGDVNSFTAEAETCSGTGLLGGCTVTSVTSTTAAGETPLSKEPWTAHTTGTSIEITNVNIDNALHGAFCPYHTLVLKGTVTATPHNTHKASTGTLSNVTGALEAYNGTSGATVAQITAAGTLTASPATYGIT